MPGRGDLVRAAGNGRARRDRPAARARHRPPPALGSGFAMCLPPWDGDLHADHEAAGRAAFDACAVTGVGLLSYPIWTWHWAHPRDSRVPWDRAVRVPLPAEVAQRKRVAIDC